MSISTFDISKLFKTIPNGLKYPLLEAYNEIQKNYRENRWEPSELNGGKLCEIIYTIIRGYIDGSYPSTPLKPANMVDACRNLESVPSSFPRSIRIQIPRMLMALYEIRNNRGVGHVGGDVNPNHMDANAVLYMSKWLMSELVRIFHNVSTYIATEIIDSIVERTLQIVWEVNGVKRILNQSLTMKEKTLILLYQSHGSVSEADLIDWLEYSNASVFRSNVLRKLHKDKIIEYNEVSRIIYLSPKGINYVEENIDLNL